jgi:hypothetical protein
MHIISGELFRGLTLVSFSTIFDLFKINEEFHNYLETLKKRYRSSDHIKGAKLE